MLERLLLRLDVGAGAVITRCVLGATFAFGFRALAPAAGLGAAALSLMVLLFMLKVFAALARRVVPTTPTLRALWEWRRGLARAHDSFQWRKLLWIGAGILAAGAGHAGWEPVLGVGCVVAGAVGELAWRRKRLAPVPPTAA